MTQTEEIQKIETQFMKALKKNSGTAIAMGSLLLLLGFLAMASPLVAGVSIKRNGSRLYTFCRPDYRDRWIHAG